MVELVWVHLVGVGLTSEPYLSNVNLHSQVLGGVGKILSLEPAHAALSAIHQHTSPSSCSPAATPQPTRLMRLSACASMQVWQFLHAQIINNQFWLEMQKLHTYVYIEGGYANLCTLHIYDN